jgi:nucleotidyltransferase substrate binding protein (TIGR01987 family)
MNVFDIRWKQRFQNFDRAFLLLRSAVEENEIGKLSMLEQEGIIQRFEYTYELAWKTLKDYLQDNGNTILPEVTAKAVFKEAFSAGIIKDGQVFIDMMLSRNLLSHCYDFEKFKEILKLLKERYLTALSDLYDFFLERVIE